jgi:hypothetical protein
MIFISWILPGFTKPEWPHLLSMVSAAFLVFGPVITIYYLAILP